MTARRFSTLDVRVDGPVAWVRFDRPDARNAVTTEMVVEMHAALTGLSRDDALTVVVLTGAGSTFCPGADLNRAGSSEPVDLPGLEVYQSATLLHAMPQLTVAAVNGGCAGAGFAWAAACDLRVAAAGARFSTAFLQVGLASELGLPWTLSRSVGGAMARDLCFLPRKLDAEEAFRMGFLSRVLPDERFADEVGALVDELGSRSPAAVRAMKANFLLAERSDLAGYVEQEARRHQAFFTGAAREETVRALRRQGERVHRGAEA
ncbi:enoyl-CoA hydratase/isomerase family protein [Pseudonocardia kunmingensis]|uniref:Enoyl-CoA hydratase n=1 Tax=Pseudonocardia kunmingensis TaxID=630975 RepID=A0A543DPS9_9PSEU|nr:enoyl-CoA hydratase/isomerase family protein [Pseudonocardia kunmingensis]TQM11342.1 enoyl-CoA hydratase [Pseudonocardia kunmingensis]